MRRGEEEEKEEKGQVREIYSRAGGAGLRLIMEDAIPHSSY